MTLAPGAHPIQNGERIHFSMPTVRRDTRTIKATRTASSSLDPWERMKASACCTCFAKAIIPHNHTSFLMQQVFTGDLLSCCTQTLQRNPRLYTMAQCQGMRQMSHISWLVRKGMTIV